MAGKAPLAYLRVESVLSGLFVRLLSLLLIGAACVIWGEVAHAHGVIHRDMKPSNLILDQDGLLKLTDFRQSRIVGRTHLGQRPDSCWP